MFNRKRDLFYMKIFFCTINLFIVCVFISRFWTAIVDFTSNDQQFHSIFHEPGAECRNLTLVADYLLKTKNENGVKVLLNIAYATTIFSSILLIGIQNILLLVFYSAFLVALLTLNLFVPFLHQFSTTTYFITTTVLHLTFSIFHSYLPKEEYQTRCLNNNHLKNTKKSSKNKPPALPPRPIEMMDHSFFA